MSLSVKPRLITGEKAGEADKAGFERGAGVPEGAAGTICEETPPSKTFDKANANGFQRTGAGLTGSVAEM